LEKRTVAVITIIFDAELLVVIPLSPPDSRWCLLVVLVLLVELVLSPFCLLFALVLSLFLVRRGAVVVLASLSLGAPLHTNFP